MRAGSRHTQRCWTGLAALPAILVAFSGSAIAQASSPSRSFLFAGIEREHSVAKIDATMDEVVARTAVSGEVVALAASPSGAELYVATNDGCECLSVMDSVSGRVLETIPLPAAPGRVVASRDGAWVFASLPKWGAVAVIGTADRRLHRELAVGRQAYGLAVAPAGSRVYVAGATGFVATNTNDGDSVAGQLVIAPLLTSAFGEFLYGSGGDEHTFNLSNDQELAPPYTGHVVDGGIYAGVVDVVVSPDGTRAYYGGAEGFAGDYVSKLYVVDTESRRLLNSVSFDVCGEGLRHLVISRDGRNLYAADSDQVYHVTVGPDGSLGMRGVRPVSTGIGSGDMAISDDGGRVFVSGFDSTIAVVDTAEDTLLSQIPVTSWVLTLATAPEAASSSGSGCTVGRGGRGAGILPLFAGVILWLAPLLRKSRRVREKIDSPPRRGPYTRSSTP